MKPSKFNIKQIKDLQNEIKELEDYYLEKFKEADELIKKDKEKVEKYKNSNDYEQLEKWSSSVLQSMKYKDKLFEQSGQRISVYKTQIYLIEGVLEDVLKFLDEVINHGNERDMKILNYLKLKIRSRK